MKEISNELYAREFNIYLAHLYVNSLGYWKVWGTT